MQAPLSLRYRDPAANPFNARHYMFENRAIKLINRQLTFSIFQGYTVQASTVFRITQFLSSGLYSFKVLSIKLKVP